MPKSTTRTKSKPKDYQLAPKDKAWLDTKLRDYNAVVGKSIDAETHFAAREKEWLAALKVGRQSARDRFKAGKILMAIQKKVTDEIGYPFWPWLRSMGVPEKTAERAIELTKFYQTEDRLADKTISECYAEMKAAKAKAKAKDVEDDNDDHANAEDIGDGSLGKDTDTVSLPLSRLTRGKKHDHGQELEDDPNNESEVEQEDIYDQEACLLDLNEIEDLLRDHLKLMGGSLGPFPHPEKVVTQIEKCAALLDELKSKVPMGNQQGE